MVMCSFVGNRSTNHHRRNKCKYTNCYCPGLLCWSEEKQPIRKGELERKQRMRYLVNRLNLVSSYLDTKDIVPWAVVPSIFSVEVLETQNVHADTRLQVWQTSQNLNRENNEWLVLLTIKINVWIVAKAVHNRVWDISHWLAITASDWLEHVYNWVWVTPDWLVRKASPLWLVETCSQLGLSCTWLAYNEGISTLIGWNMFTTRLELHLIGQSGRHLHSDWLKHVYNWVWVASDWLVRKASPLWLVETCSQLGWSCTWLASQEGISTLIGWNMFTTGFELPMIDVFNLFNNW